MSKGTVGSAGSFWQELLQSGIYKGSQGRVARQATFGALAIAFLLAAWEWRYVTSPEVAPWWLATPAVRWTVAGLLAIGGLWVSYRLVNFPRFADFLIAVEAEMNKVSWPSRRELFRASLIVIFVMFALAAILFGYDILWRLLFVALGVLRG